MLNVTLLSYVEISAKRFLKSVPFSMKCSKIGTSNFLRELQAKSI